MKSRCVPLLVSAALLVLVGCTREWDAMTAPDVQGKAAMASVDKFVQSYGWNMQRSEWLFKTNGRPARMIRGLPWKRLKGDEFPAVTHNGILYVLLNRGPGEERSGVAFNPQTNLFASPVRGFRPIGGRWYVWVQPENQTYTYLQRYE